MLPLGFEYIRHPARLPMLAAGRETTRHPVLICGGGPVGLAMALGLAKRGIRTVVVEADDTVCIGSRAICLSRRSMEILDRLGVLQPFLDKGLPWTGGRSFYRDQEILHFLMPHDDNQRLAPMTNLQQYYIEQFLLDAVQRHPDLIELRWQTRLRTVAQHEDRVVIGLHANDTGYETDAEYVVACDGARSAVRQSLGLRMAGTSYEGRYIIVDIEIDLDLPAERLAWFDPPSAPGRTLLMHKQPDNLWRIDYQLASEEDADEMVRPERVAPIVEAHLRLLGITRPWRMVWTSMYRAAAVSMERYRHGRVMFAGDAAHLVPIFGVRGLNSGFDDAYNLAWKLAYVINGRANPPLLDSYSDERRFAWETNIAHAMKSTEFMAPPSRGFELMRDALLSLAGTHVALRALINPRQSSAITYASSSLNQPDTDTAFGSGPIPGQPLPEVPLQDAFGRMVFLTEAISDDFTLLVYANGAFKFATDPVLPTPMLLHIRASGDPGSEGCLIDPEGRFQAVFDAKPGTAYLVRPDGHVCGRWRDVSGSQVRRALATAIAETGR